jgi:hydroxyethylthiazole kinase-like uncharacterized protein yjeF
MRVCTAREMAAIDRETIADGVAGEVLMERAGAAMTEVLWEFLESLDTPHHHHDDGGHGEEMPVPRVLIICGKGNNGGDGLVMARLLHDDGADVTVMMLARRGELSADTGLNYDRLPSVVSVVHAERGHWAEALGQLVGHADAVVDAIFGTGIVPPLKEAHADLIRALNDAGVPTVAVDIPSGVCGDDGKVDPVAVAADMTITVGLPKRGLLLRPGRDFTGDQIVVDIGFAPEICRAHTADHHCLQSEDYLALLPPRPTDSHKYQCGTVLVLAGSRAYGGAAHLAGLGALRSGAGLVTVAVPRCLEIPLRVGLPEALTVPLGQTDAGTLAPIDEDAWQDLLTRRDAVAVGPGLGADPETDAWVVECLDRLHLPVVVDADALGAFARLGRTPHFGSSQVVLTPHAGELSRLVGLTSAEVQDQKLELLPRLAAQWEVTLLLKGSPTLIATPEGRLYFNPTGDDALARGGSGDVLTGLIAGLLAQGRTATEAALLGAYVHGKAGTLSAEGRSTRSVLVRETAAAIGPVFEQMEKEASATASLRELIWPVKHGDV